MRQMAKVTKAALPVTALAALTLMLSGCDSPMGPIAGGKLPGPAAVWPDDWSFSTDVENVFLETDPGDPYSVTLWGVAVNANFYVAADDPDSAWAKKIGRDPEVVLSVSGNLYAAYAEIATDDAELAAVLTAYRNKYDVEANGESFIERGGLVFRLTPR